MMALDMFGGESLRTEALCWTMMKLQVETSMDMEMTPL